MRHLAVLFALVALLIASGHAQDSQPQRFRGGVDLIAIDVSAVDSKGRPVEDLKPGDFVVKVDGKARPIVSAELIKVERGKAAPTRPVDALTSTNQMAQNVRRIIVAADQTPDHARVAAPLQRPPRSSSSGWPGRLRGVRRLPGTRPARRLHDRQSSCAQGNGGTSGSRR